MPRPSLIAQYPSRCAGCDESIFVGDLIALDEPDGEWLHEECALDVPWPEEDCDDG
jgi:hypothetical protein